MGGQNEKYIKTREDIVESLVKKGADLNRIMKETHCSEDALLSIVFMPNIWSLLHLAVWYGNQRLVSEIIQNEKCNVNLQDNNLETPLFLAAVIDDKDIFKTLWEHKSTEKTVMNRQNQDIITFTAVHDAKNCFLLLNENISPDYPEFEKFAQICKEAGSDNIGKILEKINQDKNVDVQSLSSIDVYQENIPGGSEHEKSKRNRGATVNTNFNKEKR